MIVFDLQCRKNGHVFEGWFGSSEDYDRQHADGLLCCPICGDTEVTKAVMAPNVGRKGNQHPSVAATDMVINDEAAPPQVPAPSMPSAPAAVSDNGRSDVTVANTPKDAAPADMKRLLSALAKAQSKALAQSKWVGCDFAEQARAMHYGEVEQEQIHGEASGEEAEALIEEGVALMPLPFPVQPPEKQN
ncbi:MAG: DUF1178 family protein [Pseudomonadota bacterium]